MVHFTKPPEPALRERIAEALVESVRFGGEPGPDTRWLVNGSPSTLDGMPLLEGVIIPWAGVPRKTLELARERGVALFNLHHNAHATAEMALTLLFAAARGLTALDRRLRVGDWSNRTGVRNGVQLYGKTVAVLGYGGIGRHVGQVCRAMGMGVVGIKRTAGKVDGVECFGVADLHAALSLAHALVICAPGTESTTGLIGRAEIEALREPRLLVNVGRGGIIDERALHERLADGTLHAAGLDVWYRYPKGDEPCFPSAFPIHEMPNVVLSPHTGGGTRESEELRTEAVVSLLRALIAGERPRAVDLDAGY